MSSRRRRRSAYRRLLKSRYGRHSGRMVYSRYKRFF